jgi:hypothetical protein
MFVFLMSLLIFMFISYIIFWDQNRVKPLFNHYSKRNSFEVTLFSVCLFWLISVLLLMILVIYKDAMFNKLLENCSHKGLIIDSGLCFSISLVFTGLLIRLIYYVIFKCVNKCCKRKYLDSLDGKEQTWVFVLACIMLVSIGVKEKDYNFAYFVIALIVGKFFWLDNTISDFKEIFNNIKHLAIDVLFIFGYCIYFILLVLYNENNIIIGIVGSVLGFILGILLYAYKNRNK